MVDISTAMSDFADAAKKTAKVLKGIGYPRIEYWVNQRGRWSFHRKSRNGQITEPSQSYSRKDSALKAAKRDIGDLPTVQIKKDEF